MKIVDGMQVIEDAYVVPESEKDSVLRGETAKLNDHQLAKAMRTAQQYLNVLLDELKRRNITIPEKE